MNGMPSPSARSTASLVPVTFTCSKAAHPLDDRSSAAA